MELAIEIIKREIAQRELAQKHNHLRKEEVELELKSLNKALVKICENHIVKHSDDMVTEEYIYKKDFLFQRMQNNGKWYVTYKNTIITYGQYRHDLEEWIDNAYKYVNIS